MGGVNYNYTTDGTSNSISDATTTLTVTPATLTVSGITAADKTYDGHATATLLGLPAASLAGVLGKDTVTLNATRAKGTFASTNVGDNIAVSVTGLEPRRGTGGRLHADAARDDGEHHRPGDHGGGGRQHQGLRWPDRRHGDPGGRPAFPATC